MAEHYTGLGTIAGPAGRGFFDAFYFSITCYTALGFGGLYLSGAVRMLSGVVRVGWTALLTYLFMEKSLRLRGPAEFR